MVRKAGARQRLALDRQDVDPDGVVSGRAVRLGPVLHRGLGVAGLVGGADLEHVLPGGSVPDVVPLAPGVDRVLGGEFRFVPDAVDGHLDGLDAAVLRPGHAGDRHLARGHAAASLRHVDAGFGLDRPLLGPALLHPVGVERAEGGELHVYHPLGRGHVAVQSRHHHPHRVTVLLRQQLAVHAHREHGLPAVHDRLGGHADRHPVDVAHDDLVGARLYSRLAQHVREQHALPAGVADVAAAHRFRDAGQGDVVLDHGPLDQVVEREGDRLVHHAVDAQLPGRRPRPAARPGPCRPGRTSSSA